MQSNLFRSTIVELELSELSVSMKAAPVELQTLRQKVETVPANINRAHLDRRIPSNVTDEMPSQLKVASSTSVPETSALPSVGGSGDGDGSSDRGERGGEADRLTQAEHTREGLSPSAKSLADDGRVLSVPAQDHAHTEAQQSAFTSGQIAAVAPGSDALNPIRLC